MCQKTKPPLTILNKLALRTSSCLRTLLVKMRIRMVNGSSLLMRRSKKLESRKDSSMKMMIRNRLTKIKKKRMRSSLIQRTTLRKMMSQRMILRPMDSISLTMRMTSQLMMTRIPRM